MARSVFMVLSVRWLARDQDGSHFMNGSLSQHGALFCFGSLHAHGALDANWTRSFFLVLTNLMARSIGLVLTKDRAIAHTNWFSQN
jgi:hypothetical protein